MIKTEQKNIFITTETSLQYHNSLLINTWSLSKLVNKWIHKQQKINWQLFWEKRWWRHVLHCVFMTFFFYNKKTCYGMKHYYRTVINLEVCFITVILILIHCDLFIGSSFRSEPTRHCLSWTVRAGELKYWENVHPHHVSHVMLQMSLVSCHMSHVTWQVSTSTSTSTWTRLD